MDDVARVRDCLRPLQRPAQKLRWAPVRPWLANTHVDWDSQVPTVDLVDLSTGLATRAVRNTLRIAPELETGAIAYVTGRGRGSAGPRSPMAQAVRAELVSACEAHPGWRLRASGHNRTTLVTDPERAPTVATGETGLGLKVMATAFAVAVLLALANLLGLI